MIILLSTKQGRRRGHLSRRHLRRHLDRLGEAVGQASRGTRAPRRTLRDTFAVVSSGGTRYWPFLSMLDNIPRVSSVIIKIFVIS